MKQNKTKNISKLQVENKSKLSLFKKSKLTPWLVALSIAILTFIVFSPSLKCRFTNWDDPLYVQNNPLVVNSLLSVKEIFQTPIASNYHPLTILTLAWNYQLDGFTPKGYHSWNVILHILNTLLTFIFIFLLTKRNLLMASIVSLFFGIHPMHVESVTWISERKDVLYVFFFLAGLITYLHYCKSKKVFWYLITLLLFVLSILSKGMAVVFPVILMLIDYLLKEKIPMPNINKPVAWWKQTIILEKIPFFLLSLGFGIAAYKIQHDVMGYTKVFTFFERIGFASYGAIMYMVKLFIPFNLSALYLYPRADLIPNIIYLSPFMLAGFIAAIYFFMRKEKMVVFGVLFYFTSVILVLQFVPVGNAIMAERYTYLPYIGLIFPIAHLMNIAWRGKNSALNTLKYPLAGLLLSGAIIFSYQTYKRTQIWMNSETLWTDVINQYPETCFVAYGNRADYYENVKHDDERSLQDYTKSLKINPTFTNDYYHRAVIYSKLGQNDLAIADYNKILELNPNYESVYYDRGCIYNKIGKYDLAIADYNKTIELNPNNSDAYKNRGFLYYGLGKYNLAMIDYDKTLELNPTNAEAYNNRGIIYAISGKLNLALSDFSKAIKLNSAGATYWLNRSRAENALGKKDEAKADALKAQQLGIKVEDAYLNGLGIK